MTIENTDKDTIEQKEAGAAAEEIQQQTTPEDELRSGLEALANEQAGQSTEEQPSGKKAQQQEEPASKSTETEKGDPNKDAAAQKGAETKENDSFFDSLPEDNPSPDHWKQMREQYKALKKSVKDNEARLAQAAQAHRNEQPQPQFGLGRNPPQAPQKKYEASFLVETIAKINAGQLGDEYRREAEDHIARTLSPAELRQVMEKARNGGFGELSTEVFDTAKDYLPIVMASAEENRQLQMQAAQYQQLRQAAWNETLQAYPGMDNTETENGKLFSGAFQELSAEIPGIQTLPNAIRIVRQFVEMRAAMNERDTLKTEKQKLETELKTLRQKYGIVTAPQKPGAGTNNQKQKTESPEDALRAGLAEHGIGQ